MSNPAGGAALMAVLLFASPFGASAADPMTKASGPATVSSDDIEFFREAAQAGMLEVKAASIASSRALASATRVFASNMATGHNAHAAALQALATSKGVTLPAQLDDKRREVLNELQNSGPKGFDRRYAAAMRGAHHEAVELFKETAEESEDASIRAFARKSLPALERRLEDAERLTSKA